MGVSSVSMGAFLGPRNNQRRYGATHRHGKKLTVGIRVPLGPKDNSRRYRGCPRAQRETKWEYWGVP